MTKPHKDYAPVAFAAPDVAQSDVDAVVRVLRSGWLTTGQECIAFEEELSEYLGLEAVVVSSCTAALEITFASLALGQGARVGVPTWTFAASALAPLHAGARIVLLDVEPDTLNLSCESLAGALELGLDAVVPVHFGGLPVSPEVRELCLSSRVPVVEDAAHALGAVDDRGRLAGHGSVSACFSFYATKNLTTGEGGALVTEDPSLAEFARTYRQHGMSRDAWNRYRPAGEALYDLLAPGVKANLPDLLAALGRSQLSRFASMQAKRRALVDRYREQLAGTGIVPVPAQADVGSADHLFVVGLPVHARRSTVIRELRDAGVSTSVHFQPLHTFRWFAENAEIGPSGVAVADHCKDHTMSLPLHPGLRDEDVDRVCDVLVTAVGVP